MDRQEAINQYNLNKDAKIGEDIACPCCGVIFKKKTKQQAFCSNGRTVGAGNCKDAYWNKMDENKRNRKHKPSHYDKYNKGDKSYSAYRKRTGRGSPDDDHPFSSDGLGQWCD